MLEVRWCVTNSCVEFRPLRSYSEALVHWSQPNAMKSLSDSRRAQLQDSKREQDVVVEVRKLLLAGGKSRKWPGKDIRVTIM